LARYVARIGAGGARGAIEGIAYGTGEALSEAAKADDYDNLAEKLIAGGAEGGVFGGGTGAILSGLGAVAESGLGKLTKGKNLRTVAKDMSEDMAVHAIEPSKKAARELASTGRTRAVGRELLDLGIVSREAGGLRNGTEEMLERATKVVADKGDE